MRFAVVLVLALAGLSFTAAAQQRPKKLTVKPAHRDPGSKTSVPVRVPNTGSSVDRQLKMAEQSGVKVGSAKVARPRKAAPVKMQREKSNPPIHFATAASTGHATQNNLGANPYKGRLKQKHGGK